MFKSRLIAAFIAVKSNVTCPLKLCNDAHMKQLQWCLSSAFACSSSANCFNGCLAM